MTQRWIPWVQVSLLLVACGCESAVGTPQTPAGAPEGPGDAVPWEGMGLAPAVAIEPAEFTFEALPIGCAQETEIQITNVGWGTLELAEVAFAPTSEELEASYPSGLASYLEPGEVQVVVVRHTPGDETPDTGVLSVASNDPARPEATATQTGNGVWSAPATDAFTQDCHLQADILWVVDDSESMDEEQASLALNFSSFIDILVARGVDYHVAVVSTADPLFRGPTPVMDPGTPDVHAAFADAVQLGADGSSPNEGLRVAWEALSTPNTDPGGPNDGFLRPDASLHVIFVSDSDDQSPDTVVVYASALSQLLADPGSLFIHGILATPASRYEDAVSMTHGTLADIHDPTWVDGLSGLTWCVTELCDTFVLGAVPTEDSLEVSVNEDFLIVGWTYDSGLNAVVFEPGYVPGYGEVVTVKYGVQPDC
jgi:hypothetical protein